MADFESKENDSVIKISAISFNLEISGWEFWRREQLQAMSTGLRLTVLMLLAIWGSDGANEIPHCTADIGVRPLSRRLTLTL